MDPNDVPVLARSVPRSPASSSWLFLGIETLKETVSITTVAAGHPPRQARPVQHHRYPAAR